MTIVFERLDHDPIVISTSTEPLRTERDGRQAVDELARYLQEIPGNGCYISDMTRLNPPSFTDVVMGLAAVTQIKNGPLNDTRLRIYIVASADMLKLAVDSLRQAQYGAIDAKLFGTKEDALREARLQFEREQ